MKAFHCQSLCKILLILVAAGFFSACKHDLNLKPGNYIPGGGNGGNTGSGGNDTTGGKGAPSFYSPAAVAVDAAGNIYVADYGNNMIRKITVDGVVSTLAGNGTQGAVNATGKLATFNQPTGLAVDASGNVLVADAGNDVIRKITPDGVVTNYAGSDSTGTADGPVATATFFHPEGLAINGSGNVFVADAGNSLIRKISGGVVSTIAGNNANASTTGILGNPSGLAIDATGNLYVANYINSNILKIDPTNAITTYAGSSTGQTGFANGQDTLATFYFPNSVALDAAGNLYVADGVNNVIRKITPGRLVSTFAGSGTAGAADGTGANASFDHPSGIAADAEGNIYVADSNNNLIRKISPAGVVTTIAGNGQSGANNGQAVARKNIKTIKVAAKKPLSVFFNK